MATDDTNPTAAITDLTPAARLRQLIRIRWAVRGVLTIGVAVSLAANILHADADPISKAISAWPPIALLLAIELISRVPLSNRRLASIRIAATTAIAGIAAWISYGHMTAVAAHYGERGGTPYLLPLSVDGLVAAASVSLVELASRIRIDSDEPPPAAFAATGITSRPESDRAIPPTVDRRVNRRPASGQPAVGRPTVTAHGHAPPNQIRGAEDVTAAVAVLRRREPTPTAAEIAQQVGRSVRQVLRIIKRLEDIQADEPEPTDAAITSRMT
jgi:Protein of unknown function (DUF2637)